MTELAIIVPTRGRPENIRKVISAWDFTNAWDLADLVLVADADDPEIDGYRRVMGDFNQEPGHGTDLNPGALSMIQVPKWLPMVHKLNAAARDLASRYWALGFAGDDHLPQTIGWAERYLTVLHELGTGMVYSDDGYQGAKLSTEWAVTSDAVTALGRMVPAPVEHMYCDNSMMALFGGAGAMRHLPEVRIEHMHPYAGKADTDAQYKRVNHRDQMNRDRASFNAWYRSGLADDIVKIRELRRGLPNVTNEPIPARPKVAGSGPRRVPPRATSRPSSERVNKAEQANKASPASIRFGLPRHFKTVRGATPDEIGVTLADFATQVPADQEIVELGVFQGRTALMMAWGASQGAGAHLTGIDAWDLPGNTYGPPFTDPESYALAKYNVMSLGYNDRIMLVRGFASGAAAVWTGGPIGLLFVDDDHSYEGATRAVKYWAPHLAPGAVIAVDDYGHPDWPGVREAVDELVAEGVLAPVQIFHERLAVTRLTASEQWSRPVDVTEPITAITSEGVSPSPVCGDACSEAHTYAAGCEMKVPSGPGWTTGEEPDPEPQPNLAQPMPVPFVATESSILQPLPVVVSLDESVPVGPARTMTFAEAEQEVPGISALEPPLRVVVSAGELEGVAEGTTISELTMPQMKALAKARGIVLGYRKNKRDETLQALKDGK